MMTNDQQPQLTPRAHTDHEDSMVDAVAAIVLTMVFVVASIYWISGQ